MATDISPRTASVGAKVIVAPLGKGITFRGDLTNLEPFQLEAENQRWILELPSVKHWRGGRSNDSSLRLL